MNKKVKIAILVFIVLIIPLYLLGWLNSNEKGWSTKDHEQKQVELKEKNVPPKRTNSEFESTKSIENKNENKEKKLSEEISKSKKLEVEKKEENQNTPIKVNKTKLHELYETNQLKKYLLHLEQRFSQNEYHGQVGSGKVFIIQKGTIPVLLSAPHTTKHPRNEVKKVADVYTGSYALLLQELSGVHLIYTNQFPDKDPNYDEEEPYKKALQEYVETHEIKYIIDLHGAARSRPFEVDLGTLNGISIEKEIVEVIKEIFANNHIYKVEDNHTFTGKHPGTIAYQSYHRLNTPAIQVELNRNLRDPRNEINHSYNTLLSLLAIIEELANE